MMESVPPGMLATPYPHPNPISRMGVREYMSASLDKLLLRCSIGSSTRIARLAGQISEREQQIKPR